MYAQISMLKSSLRKDSDRTWPFKSEMSQPLRLAGKGQRRPNKMFSVVTGTWNPVSGCLHNCSYCWARRLAETKLKYSTRYKNGFLPRLNEAEFQKKFNGGMIFVCDMGDLFAARIPDEWIQLVLDHARKFENTTFLFLTKNPRRYHSFEFYKNMILGATIETDLDTVYRGISNAPMPSERLKAMIELDWDRKFLSIEPIVEFSSNFLQAILDVNPAMIYCGYDNYNNALPEPPMEKVIGLIKELREKHCLVVEKTIRLAWNERVI